MVYILIPQNQYLSNFLNWWLILSHYCVLDFYICISFQWSFVCYLYIMPNRGIPQINWCINDSISSTTLTAPVSHFSLKCYIETTLGLMNPFCVSRPLCCTISLLTESWYCLQESAVSHLNRLLPAFSQTFFKQVNTGSGDAVAHIPDIIWNNAD